MKGQLGGVEGPRGFERLIRWASAGNARLRFDKYRRHLLSIAADAKPRIAELTEGDELIPVKVEGRPPPSYLHREAGPMTSPSARPEGHR